MAAITDLTWQQLQDAIGVTDAIAVVGGVVTIDVSKISGDTIDALSDTGVVKFVNKLLENCAEAQATVNGGQATGERLAAFGNATIGAPTNGQVPVSRVVQFRYALESVTNIVGPNS